jgi:hypothetical protein
MSLQSIQAGACLGSAFDRPSQCDQDPVRLRAIERAREAEQRRAALLAATHGMTPSPPIETRLEELGSIEVPIGPGQCHVLLWSLAADAKPDTVRISLSFDTQRSSDGGLTGFDTNARIGSTGLVCSSQAGKERFRVVDA